MPVERLGLSTDLKAASPRLDSFQLMRPGSVHARAVTPLLEVSRAPRD